MNDNLAVSRCSYTRRVVLDWDGIITYEMVQLCKLEHGVKSLPQPVEGMNFGVSKPPLPVCGLGCTVLQLARKVPTYLSY